MPCINVGGAIVSMAGPDHTIKVRGRRWVFEWHDYLGPTLLGKRGAPLAHEPGYVLEAIGLWDRQGERVVDGTCVWEKEPEPTLWHVAGRHWISTYDGKPPPRLPAGVSLCPGCPRCAPPVPAAEDGGKPR